MPTSMQPEIVFDGHAAIGEGRVWATGSRGRCGWTSHMGECTGSTQSTGSDDVFGVGKPVGAVGLRTGKIKVSGRLSGKRRLRVPVCAHVLAGQLFYLGLQNCRAIHGKEKVYGSIP